MSSLVCRPTHMVIAIIRLQEPGGHSMVNAGMIVYTLK